MAKSLVLVTVDCLRADHVGFNGYSRPVTPFLDSIAQESFVLPSAIVAGAPTYYSFPAIFASRHPLALGRDLLGIAAGESSLATILSQTGYATAAFSAGNPYISARFGFDQGFDTFRDFLDERFAAIAATEPAISDRWQSRLNRSLQKVRAQMGAFGLMYDELYFQYCQRRATPAVKSMDTLRRFPSADVLVDQARAWLASVGQGPFFLWLHLMDPHAPYYPTEQALALMGQNKVTPFRARYMNSSWNRSDIGTKRLAGYRDEIIGLYDSGIRWVDVQMARLVEALRRFKLWDNCIFTVTADHGEEFLDHGGRFHPPTRLMEELIHVPLLIRVPGVAASTKLAKSPFSLVNLAPTLLEAAEIELPASFRGQSYWQKIRSGEAWEQAAVAEAVSRCTNPYHRADRLGPRALAIREARFKLHLQFDPYVEDLYDLDADPQERSPLPASAEKSVRRRLLESAREHIRKSAADRDPAVSVPARLRELRLEWALPSPQNSAA